MVFGMDGIVNAQGGVYIMALDIQDIHTKLGYDFATHMTEMIHNEIMAAQMGGMQNFKFHQYSFLMHMILFYNKDIVGPYFVEALDEFGVLLPMQLWTRC